MTPARLVAIFHRHFPDLLGQRLLVALSGGADSVALLVLLREAQGELGVWLHAAHVHHHLRGGEADEDAAWCARLCREMGVSFTLCHLGEPTPPRGVSPEAWWRQQRYRILEEEAERQRCAAVLTAHTLDDQAETVLLKVLSGGGPRAVMGIRRRLGRWVRPLLEERRAALRTLLAERRLGWREDSSNRDLQRPRAWIRHGLLPLLEERFPRASEHLAWLAGDAAADEEILGAQVARLASWPEVGGSVPLTVLRELPAALLARWTLALASRLPLAEPPSRVQLAQVANLVTGGEPAAVDLGRRWVVRRLGGRLYLLPPPCPAFGPYPAAGEVLLPGGWRTTLGAAAEPAAPYQVWLKAEVLAAQPVWRSLRRGEGWPEMGRKSLAKALAAAGVPSTWRRAWPVLEAGGRIVWVPAVGVAAAWAGERGTGVAATLEEPWQRRWK